MTIKPNVNGQVWKLYKWKSCGNARFDKGAARIVPDVTTYLTIMLLRNADMAQNISHIVIVGQIRRWLDDVTQKYLAWCFLDGALWLSSKLSRKRL